MGANQDEAGQTLEICIPGLDTCPNGKVLGKKGRL